MKNVLLTAFDPFGGDSFNAAQYAVENCRAPEGVELHKLIVPTVFRLAAEKVAAEIERLHPDVIICVGEGSSRHMVTPERVAVNVMDARIPDNSGYQPEDIKIADDGPDAYFSMLPIKEMVRVMSDAGFAAEISNSAGTFVCNSLMYGVLHYVNTHYPGGFDYITVRIAPGPAASDIAAPNSGASNANAIRTVAYDGAAFASGSYHPISGFIHVPADRPVVNPDGSLIPVPLTSAQAISEALKALL